MSKQFAFPSSQRLRSKKRIDELFKNGRGIVVKPLRITWIAESATETHKAGCEILVSVSKRNFKRSNKRNTIKRRLRESWRLNSSEFNQLITDKNISIFVAIIYTDKEIAEFKTIETNLITAIDKLKKKLEPLVEKE